MESPKQWLIHILDAYDIWLYTSFYFDIYANFAYVSNAV